MTKVEFYINKNQYKTEQKHPSYANKKVVIPSLYPQELIKLRHGVVRINMAHTLN